MAKDRIGDREDPLSSDKLLDGLLSVVNKADVELDPFHACIENGFFPQEKDMG